MAILKTSALAKINISLDITGKRSDGYHELRMIMQSVSLCDDVIVETGTGKEIELRSNLRYLPNDRRNIAYAAAVLFFEDSGITNNGIKITLNKRIPVSAGLAGGSTDAAAVLRILNTAYENPYSKDELRSLSLKLGADVPFCISGGTALSEGIGEILTPLPPLPECHIVICKPPVNVSTPNVFSRVNLQKISLRPDTKGLLECISSRDISGVSRRLYNVLEEITGSDYPVIGEIKSTLISCGALGAVMSGSGPTVFGIFEDIESAEFAYSELNLQYCDCHIVKPSACVNVTTE